MRIAVGTKHVKLISREHRSTPMTPEFGLVMFLICLLMTPIILVYGWVASGFTVGLEYAAGILLAGLFIGIKSAGNKKR
jgi:uncharacterized RDD family membrane protein YckC